MLNQTNARAGLAKVLDPIARGLLKIGLSADAVTLIGTIGTSLAAAYYFPRGEFVIGILIMLLFIPSDMLDGTMARLSGRTGMWGAFLDSTLDRVADGIVFGSILIWAVSKQSLSTQYAALICLVGALVISYAKARALSLDADCDVGIAERTERLIIVLVAAFFYGVGVPYLLPAALWVLAVLVVITVGQRMLHVRKQLL